MNEKIKETFDAEGIRIPYQQIDVHLRQKTGSRKLQ
jgi:small-conductance mechanosensitive channel